MNPQETTLYSRLGGYDAIASVADDLLPRLMADEQLGRFWQNRGDDGIRREKQLLVDFLCSSAGGPMVYTGRNMETTHRGMKISESDWERFSGHAVDTLNSLGVGPKEMKDVVGFVVSLKPEIVEA